MNQTRTETVRGASQLGFDAIVELTRLVEEMHANVSGASMPLGRGSDGHAGGIAGFVYDGVRLVSRATGFGVDRALALFSEPTDLPASEPRSDPVLSALNGVLGHHLAEHENPLAIPMRLRCGGRRSAKPLLLVHGLCMSDRGWRRNGHDHGQALARDLGHTPLYLLYNSGRHVSENGRELAMLLESSLADWPTPVEELTILAHSMGGLVVRSAWHVAESEGHSWPRHLRRIVFLGTPHHGAPLERIGNQLHGVAELSPYVAPLARLGMLRSAGITDLRHGNVLDEDWRGRDRFRSRGDRRRAIPLPEGVACYAIAGELNGLFGDGLVPRTSALGRHTDPERTLAFAKSHQWTGPGLGHFDLLDRPEVYRVIRNWLSA